MKIAIMGIRGIPANYGGFETFAENLKYETKVFRSYSEGEKWLLHNEGSVE